MSIRKILLTALAGVAVASMAAPAGAAPAPNTTSAHVPASTVGGNGFTFGVRPWASPGAPVRSAFTFDVAPGQTISDRVEIVNSSDQAKPFYVYAADAYTTEIGGGFALHLRADRPADAAAWTALPVTQYTVPARSAALVPFQVTAPPDATPGDHTAAVVAEEVLPTTPLDHGAGVVPVHRVAARLYLRVQGPVHPALQIEELTVARHEPVLPYVTGHGSTTVSFALANTGNVRAQLDQIGFKLTGAFGRSLGTVTLDRPQAGETGAASFPEQVIPGSRIRFTRTFQGLPPIEAVTAAVTVKAEDSLLHGPLSTSRSTTFWVIPWFVLGFLAVLVGLVLVVRRRRRRAGRPSGGSGRSGGPGGPAGGPPGDLTGPVWDDLPEKICVGS
jgi:hypothetical protein